MNVIIEALSQKYPLLLPTIAGAIRKAYDDFVRLYTKTRLNDPLFSQAFMKLLEPHINEKVRDEVNLLCLHGVTAKEAKNRGQQHKHTEVYVDNFVLTVSSVECPNGCPREAEYRKGLASGQIPMHLVFGDCNPNSEKQFVIITHFRRDGQFVPETIKIGIPDHTGKNWIGPPETITKDMPVEIIVATDLPVPKEEVITRTVHPRKKA